MDYKQGEFKKFRSPTDISLGELNMTLTRGAIVEFDGTTMKWGTQTYHYPKLALGIESGWVVPYEEPVEGVEAALADYRPKPAGVEVYAAQSTGDKRGPVLNVDTAVEDERVVGNVESNKERRKVASAAPRTGTPQPPAVNATPDMGYAPPAVDATPPMGGAMADVVDVTPSPGAIDAPERTSAPIAPAKKKFQVVGAGDQESVTVGKVGSSAKTRTVLTDPTAAQREMAALEKRGPVRTEKVASEVETDPEPVIEVEPETVPEPIEEDFVWVLEGIHWRTRVKIAIEKYGDKPELFKKIMAMETPGVVKALRSWQARRSATNSV